MQKIKKEIYRTFKAFSLIELMISLITISCLFAAFSPVVFKKITEKNTVSPGTKFKVCNKGNYFDGIKDCKPCPEGQYQDESGKTFCKDSPIGTYSDNEAAINYTICPEGQYQSQTKQTKCIACPKGQYQNLKGQAACKDCPAGYYQDTIGATSCKSCSSGKWSNIGASSCFECGIGTNCPFASTNSGAQPGLEQFEGYMDGCQKGYFKTSSGNCKKYRPGIVDYVDASVTIKERWDLAYYWNYLDYEVYGPCKITIRPVIYSNGKYVFGPIIKEYPAAISTMGPGQSPAETNNNFRLSCNKDTLNMNWE